MLGAGDGGLFKIGCDDDDNGADINAYVKTFAFKFGHEGNKRVRFSYMTVETDGDVIVTPIVDGVEQTPITFSANGTGRQFIRKTISRASSGVYWQFKVENVDGCWFSLDKVEVLPVNLSLGR